MKRIILGFSSLLILTSCGRDETYEKRCYIVTLLTGEKKHITANVPVTAREYVETYRGSYSLKYTSAGTFQGDIKAAVIDFEREPCKQ